MCTLRYTGMEVRFRPQSGEKKQNLLVAAIVLTWFVWFTWNGVLRTRRLWLKPYPTLQRLIRDCMPVCGLNHARQCATHTTP